MALSLAGARQTATPVLRPYQHLMAVATILERGFGSRTAVRVAGTRLSSGTLSSGDG